MNIKICENCKNEITGRGMRFCSQSCNSTHHNKGRIKKNEKPCLGCGEITTNKKYCNPQCLQDHKKVLTFKLIEEGDTTLDARQYKKYLIYTRGEKCETCGWNEINETSGNIPIELEHIDGNSKNNSLDNLKLLCPNHHSLSSTYKNLNKGNGRHARRERYHEGKSY